MPIKEHLKVGLVFGFSARLPIATFLAYLGYQNDVIHYMQRLSHGTRAYIWNADGLPNLLTKRKRIIQMLREG